MIAHGVRHETHVSSHPLVSTVRGGSRRSPVSSASSTTAFLAADWRARCRDWANLDPQPDDTLAHRLAFPVNEIGMALFLALIAHEAIDAIGPGGALRHWRHWGVPLVAAAGSVAGAAFAYLAYVTWAGELVLAQAWPVAAAVDIAAGYYVLRLIYRRGSQAFPFLLVSGIAANTVGLAVLASGRNSRPTSDRCRARRGCPERRRGAACRQDPPIVAVPRSSPAACRGGDSTWRACIRRCRWYRSCRCCRIRGTCWNRSRSGPPRPRSRMCSWITVVQVVLFFFGLVNGGAHAARLRHRHVGGAAGCAARPAHRDAWRGGALRLLAGLRLPASIPAWHDLVVVALAMSSGFTFALFTAAMLLPVGGVLTQIRVGALATAVGAALTYGVARGLRVGCFAVSR